MSDHADFMRRSHALLARGVRSDLATDLRWCGNMALIAEVEAASDAEIVALNEEYAARHP